MGEIYSAAEAVIVWLGPAHPLLPDFIWATDTLLPKLNAITTAPGHGDVYAYMPYDIRVAERLGEHNLMQRLFRFCKFCGLCRWFDRAWVLQEVVRAQMVKLRCGGEELSWERASALCEHLRFGGWESAIRGLASVSSDRDFFYDGTEFVKKNALRNLYKETGGATVPAETADAFRWMHGATNPQTLAISMLFYCVYAVQNLGCSDPRDKIFAVLGIVDRYFPEGVAKTFAADYRSSVESIYEEFTAGILRCLPLLNVLSFVADPSTRELLMLPSWVPDFSALPGPNPVNFLGKGGIFGPLLIPGVPRMARRIEDSVLHCHGGSTDVVERVSQSVVGDIEFKPNIEDLLDICCHVPTDGYGKDRVDCLWRTLIGDSFGGDHPAPADTAVKFSAALTHLGSFEIEGSLEGNTIPRQQLEQLLRQLDPSGDSIALPTIEDIETYRDKVLAARATLQTGNPNIRLLQEAQDLESLGVSYLEEMRGCFQRRLFVTRNGNMGLGPTSTQKGDHVCFIHEASVPFILRPHGEFPNYRLIGACYIHDMMHGEILGDHGFLESVREIRIV